VHEFSTKDLEDLYWLHRTISERVLELTDLASPGYFEAKAERLFDHLAVTIGGQTTFGK
jgi:hypothetical protein